MTAMRVVSVALATVLLPSLPALVGAEGKQQVARPVPKLPPIVAPVIGGDDAPDGKWDDAAAVLFGGSVACTGILIAPTVALTAAHCLDSSLNGILVGTNNLRQSSQGEILSVAQRIALRENDIAVLVLSETAQKTEPRALATGWAQFEIKNGAPVAIVGFGTINRNGSQGTDALQEAESTITDFDCSTKPGCRNFEMGAGGMGIDSCPGDSGGPLYLLTDFGEFLVGVTSRAYSNANFPCGEGGIYGRADQVIDQIEAAAGKKVKRGPEPTAENVIAIRGDGGETTIVANDPKSTEHSYKIEEQPANGTAAVREDGVVRVCVNANATPGNNDSLVVMVTDKTDTKREVPVRVGISVATNEPVGATCDPNAFETGDGGGCCDAGGRGAGGSALLGLLVVLGIRRRRK
jgi:uncharacterized protein (TIGR03382 family)